MAAGGTLQVPVAPGPVALPSLPAAPGARVEPAWPRPREHRRARDQVAPAHCPTVGEPNKELLPMSGQSPLTAEFRR